ncbi:MAG: Type II secretion system protein F [Syntrophaceae bacterium PtaU1.Bin231]|nr:MAG: Type II secretion system protein F [Syntrophaceae bacterium PtaU1.Bin231]
MPIFSYKAISENGSAVSGMIEADSLDGARGLLVAKGLIPEEVSEGAGGAASLWARVRARSGRVPVPDLILFTKQFRSMLQAGIPIVRVLQVLEVQTQNRNLKAVISLMAQDIKQGATLFDALEKHPRVFSPLYRSMMRAGEISGTVPDVLERLIYIIEHEEAVRNDIRSALRYPAIVVVALGVAFVILLTFVIPKFVTIFAKAGIELPLPTKIAMLLYAFLSNYWLLIVIALAGLVVGLRYYLGTQEGRLAGDGLLLRLPLAGPLFTKAAMSRFASIFAILYASGVPVMRALAILSGTIGNTAISKEFDKVRERIVEGEGIAAPLKSARYFTPMVIDMVAIGEESGNMEQMMREIARHYDDEVGYAVKRLSDALGPALIVGLAAVVGFFALAIFLPMWDLTKMVR